MIEASCILSREENMEMKCCDSSWNSVAELVSVAGLDGKLTNDH